MRSIAENAEPEQLTKAIGPGGIGIRFHVSDGPKTVRATFTNPMQPAPQSAMPASVAIEAMRLPERPAVHPIEDSKALPKMTAERSPRLARSVISASREESGTPRSTRSTGPGISSSDATQGRSPMLE